MKKCRYRNELIVKRRRKKLHRKVFVFFVLTIAVLVTLCLKLSYFNIKNIEVTGNKMITAQKIISDSGIMQGNNIFYVNTIKAQKKIKSNLYINNVKISRSLPDKIIISVTEKQEFYYSQAGSKYVIMDGGCSILDIRDSLKNEKLVKLSGISFNLDKSPKISTGNERKIKIANEICNLFNRLKEKSIVLSSIDLNSTTDIKVNFKDMCIIVGTDEKIEDKLNKAINIIVSSKLTNSKGRIDVSFNGNPVIYTEK